MQVNTALISFLQKRRAPVSGYEADHIDFYLLEHGREERMTGRICCRGGSGRVIVFDLGLCSSDKVDRLDGLGPQFPTAWFDYREEAGVGYRFFWAVPLPFIPETPESVQEVLEPVFAALSVISCEMEYRLTVPVVH